MISTIWENKLKSKIIKKIAVIVFWLAVWQAVSMAVNESLIIVSPWDTLVRMWELLGESTFYKAVGTSFLNIGIGFVCAAILGTLLAVISRIFRFAYELLSPLFAVIKATPVASFTLILFFWGIKGKHLSVWISLIMVLPVIFFAVYEGIGAADKKLLEMAKVYKVSKAKQIREIYLPAALPSVTSALSVAIGFAWKSGVAAEVIAIASGSVGGLLYDAKLFLESKALFAITATVIIISKLSEWLVVKLFKSREAE